jgi:hypothetical protein
LRPEAIQWLRVDLAPWAGQDTTLELASESADTESTPAEETESLNQLLHSDDGSSGQTTAGDQGVSWIRPQVVVRPVWLVEDYPPPATPVHNAGQLFGDRVQLLGWSAAPDERPQAGEAWAVTLYWQALRPLADHAKIFIHLLNSEGELIAQHDSEPVGGSYPLPAWQPGHVIADTHILVVDGSSNQAPTTLAVGLYDPDSLQRWTSATPAGEVIGDGRALLSLKP